MSMTQSGTTGTTTEICSEWSTGKKQKLFPEIGSHRTFKGV